MTPAELIADLDDAIAETGQTITLRRSTTVQTCKAVVRGYAVEKIAGLISVADRHVIVSPIGLDDFGIPRGADDCIINSNIGKVQDDVDPIYVDDVLVRVEMRVRLA
jgi:hypothetical protein